MKNLSNNKLLLVGVICFSAIGFAFKSVLPTHKNAALVNAVPVIKSYARADFNFKNVEFDTNSASIRSSSYSELNNLAAKLQETKASLKVSGFADSRGTYLYNWKLSASRAMAVKNYIVSKGCDSTKVAATEFGETKPLASNSTSTGRQKNRRVQFEAF